jgi:hypothetical protein
MAEEGLAGFRSGCRFWALEPTGVERALVARLNSHMITALGQAGTPAGSPAPEPATGIYDTRGV